MLKNLILPFSIYRLKVKMLMLQSQVKKMESSKYLNLSNRIELAQMKKMLINLHEQEDSLHHHKFTVGF
ncbi:MAG: hypothetical protein M3004_13315 [Bacteroidota bacterium]|nr:hypothetical protein [Bacteroidota bacterium]